MFPSRCPENNYYRRAELTCKGIKQTNVSLHLQIWLVNLATVSFFSDFVLFFSLEEATFFFFLWWSPPSLSRVGPAAEIIQVLFDVLTFLWLDHGGFIQIPAQHDASWMLHTGLLFVQRAAESVSWCFFFFFHFKIQDCVKAAPRSHSNHRCSRWQL